ncbi:MAG: peptidoglycan bridge formation glycyltransferase FemA/FemB family protein [Candidatus Magasanikbacteria bacterium]|nr:peptidoglycan bridge formation glycyltransferase FemA/FemB family protein [Candidatus Magasanikbacteria bacterium]
MQCRLIDDKEQWNKFVAGQSHAQFLQSWDWGEFQKEFGRRVWRVGVFDSMELIGVAQIIEHYLGFGMGYLYCPRGPIFFLSFRAERGISNDNEPGINRLFEFIKKNIVNYGHVFFRFEPHFSEQTTQESSLRGAERRSNPDNIRDCHAPRLPSGSLAMTHYRVPSIQPTHTLLLDLNKSEEQLLTEMHQKTRYNIRLAEKKDLKFSDSKTGFDVFRNLMKETSRRDKIKLHAKKYYQLMLQIPVCRLLLVNYQDKMLAGGIFIGFGDSFIYVHGASSKECRDLMAPYFLHWQAIQFAKQNGYHYYDFGGINPDDENDFDFKTSWTGITRFKRGFGGETHSFAGAYELPFQPKVYKLFQQIKKIRKLI